MTLHDYIIAAGHTSGTSNTPESYKATDMILKTVNKSFGDEYKVTHTTGHFYCSGFITKKKTNKTVWFSFSDYRHFPDSCYMRTAINDKDFMGGANHPGDSENFIQKIKELLQ